MIARVRSGDAPGAERQGDHPMSDVDVSQLEPAPVSLAYSPAGDI